MTCQERAIINHKSPFRALSKSYPLHTKSIIKGEIQVLDLTPCLLEGYTTDLGISPDFLKEASKIASSPPIPEKVFTLKKGNLIGSHLAISDKDGNNVADLKSPILSIGATTLTFPDGSENSSHPIEIKPLGIGHRAESFVKDSVTCTWENERFKIENKTLARIIDSEKMEVARYSQKRGRDNEGVLVLDAREVGELVSVLTCVEVLQHINSFSKG